MVQMQILFLCGVLQPSFLAESPRMIAEAGGFVIAQTNEKDPKKVATKKVTVSVSGMI